MTSFVPHHYQERAIELCLQHAQFGLFLQPGLGKTSVILQVAKIRLAQKMIRGVLIVAPLRVVHLVWPKEVKKWTEFRGMRVQILHGPNKQRALDTPADIYVINPEGLEWLFRVGLKSRRPYPFDMLVVDESTGFKNTATQRFHIIRKQLPKFPYRYILTGSPTPNNLIELFGQIYLLDLGKALGEYISHFYSKYCYQDTYGHTVIPGAEKLIYEKVAPLVVQMSVEDYLELPELLFNDVYVDLPPKVQKNYKEMEKLLRSEFQFGRVTAANAAVKAGKCRQIASGAMYFEAPSGATAAPVGLAGVRPLLPQPAVTGDQPWGRLHEEKIKAVQELVEELGGKQVLIGYEYQHEADRLREVFPQAVTLGGGATPSQMRKAEEAWNKGEIAILLNQMDSGSLGLNLQGGGNNIILFTPTYRLQSYEQFIARVWRQGQANARVIVHRILARNTLDDYITHSVLTGKSKSQNSLFAALKDYFNEL